MNPEEIKKMASAVTDKIRDEFLGIPMSVGFVILEAILCSLTKQRIEDMSDSFEVATKFEETITEVSSSLRAVKNNLIQNNGELKPLGKSDSE